MLILVAEDDDTSALLIGRMLKKLGHEFERAKDGVAALELARNNHRFDLVLSDWMMPRMDGLMLISELRKLLRPAPPLVILTATASDEARSQALDAGADEYLAKPVRADELGRCIERAVGRTRQKARQVALAPPVSFAEAQAKCPIVIVVAGTGGPVAVQKVLAGCTSLQGACLLILQHGPAWMVETFCLRLQSKLKLGVALVTQGDPIGPGLAYLAPGGAHLLISADGQHLLLGGGDEVNLMKPSADVLLASARSVARLCVSVVLTGIGSDGAQGAAELAAAGAEVAIQDPTTAEVANMPHNVVLTGAGPRAFPLDKLAAYIDGSVARLASRLEG